MSNSYPSSYLMSPGLFVKKMPEIQYLKIEDAASVFQNEKVCSFTGYRPEKLPFKEETDPRCIELRYKLCQEIDNLISQGYTSFISGMARGVDVWAAEMVLHLAKDSDSRVDLYAAVPYPGQPSSWYEWEKERYNEILRLCKGVFVMEDHYTYRCMSKRNAFLVKYANTLISVFDGQNGGTASTLNMANKKEMNIINITP